MSKGAAIVVGSAPCLHDDLERALELYPFAFIATVNGACVEIEHMDALVAGHTVKAGLFVAARDAAFPDGKPYEVWANYGSPNRRDEFQRDHRTVTNWFGPELSTGATSAAKAVRMTLAMDYDPVILCGCPLDNSGYFEGESQKGKSIGHDCRRVGDPDQNVHRTIVNYRDKFERLAKGEFKDKVFSMSGLTRKWLGEPRA